LSTEYKKKGKPDESWGRKTTGLRESYGSRVTEMSMQYHSIGNPIGLFFCGGHHGSVKTDSYDSGVEDFH
jgi:hypothetical protein